MIEQEEHPEPMQPTNQSASAVNDRAYMAIHNFVASEPDEVSISRGNMLEVLYDEEQRKQNVWWQVKNLETNQVGLIPSNYVAKYTGMPCLLDGWVDCNEMDANRRLLCAGLKAGTYILRASAEPNAKLALSIRTPDKLRPNNFLVKHYQIRNSPNETEFFINMNRVFSTVQKLIEFFKEGGLCSPLTDPYPNEPPVVQFKDIEVNRDTITMLKKLGAGCFTEVWMAKWNGILDVAVKTLKPDAAMTPDKFLDEAKMMHKLSHPKIVNILGVCTVLRDPTEKMLIITEFMENGSLLDYLRQNNNAASRLSISTLLDIGYQVADGMAYLEEMRFVHRDLRAASVLVGKDNFVKVADFRQSKILQDDDTYQAETSEKFPVKWTAPEAMHENRFTTKSDVWSFGVLLYEILTHGGQVYVGMTNREVMQFVRDRRNRLPVPDSMNMSPSDREMTKQIHKSYMMKCWDESPDDRPTFSFLKSEFEDIDRALENQFA